MKFLEITSLPLNGGTQRKVFYPNGYGASIVQSPYSYGGKKGQYELAVLKGTEDSWSICYDTPITSDVLGYLEPEEVDDILAQIEALPNEAKQFVDNMSDESKRFINNLLGSMEAKN